MKTEILPFLIKGGLILSLGTLCYFFIIRNSTQLNVRRFSILLIVLFALVIPKLSIPIQNKTAIPTIQTAVDNLQEIVLPELVVTDGGKATTTSTQLPISGYLIFIYLTVAILLVGRWLITIGHLIYLRYQFNSYPDNHSSQLIIDTKGAFQAFSFLNYIFYSYDSELSIDENEQILNHERIHCKQFHSFDIILLELTAAIYWFLPFIWWLKQECKQLHEFLADREVVKNSNPISYRNLLSKVALKNVGVGFSHSFYQSPILKRIKMITLNQHPSNPVKGLIMILLFSTLTLPFACKDNGSDQLNNVTTEIPADIQAKYDELSAKTGMTLTYTEIDANKESAFNFGKEISAEKLLYSFYDDERSKIGIIMAPESYNKPLESEEIYSKVEEIAEPLGGFPYLYSYISNNLVYPEVARNAGIEGKVFVQFVVNEEGKVEQAQVVKGIGSGADEEALRVVENLPIWIPGKVAGKLVKQRIVLPFTFKLD